LRFSVFEQFEQPAVLGLRVNYLPKVPPYLFLLFLHFQFIVLFSVQKIASLAVLTTSLHEVGLALFCLVFQVAFLALSKLLNSMGELALVIVAAKPSIEKISTQFVFEFFVFSQISLSTADIIV
jgi:hypothetical protein